MPRKKRFHAPKKAGLHSRNKHAERYDFQQLISTFPELGEYVKLNKFEDESIDFFNPKAVRALNKALLMHYYDIQTWNLPKRYLCPPIPGRADYIHHIADLLAGTDAEGQPGTLAVGENIRCLDIGVGANCVYPIIGRKEYGWSFTGTDIDSVALEAAGKVIAQNPILKGRVELRHQPNPKDIFEGMITADDYFDVAICNPPFHASTAEAASGTERKLKNLTQQPQTEPVRNFGGQPSELCCEGGEEQFVAIMIRQSKQYAEFCGWYSTLISKQSSLKNVYRALEAEQAVEVKTIPMSLGNKISRIVAWTFLQPENR